MHGISKDTYFSHIIIILYIYIIKYKCIILQYHNVNYNKPYSHVVYIGDMLLLYNAYTYLVLLYEVTLYSLYEYYTHKIL